MLNIEDEISRIVPSEWVLLSIDNSIAYRCSVMLQRNSDGFLDFHSLETDDERDKFRLYSTGIGATIDLALANAIYAIHEAGIT